MDGRRIVGSYQAGTVSNILVKLVIENCFYSEIPLQFPNNSYLLEPSIQLNNNDNNSNNYRDV